MQVIELGSISELIWSDKYRFKGDDGTPVDQTVDDTFKRVAVAVAQAEPIGLARDLWAENFYEAMRDFEFLPAGRILAGAGTGRDVTLINCFVMGTIPDSMDGIHDALKEAAATMKMGGGVGMDFSTLRPRGSPVKGVGSVSSGAVSFMELWNTMCGTVISAGARRGAMMGVLRVDHPDIEEFIEAKHQAGKLTNFNMSVAVTDQFMEAVNSGAHWELKFDGVVYDTISARNLWNRIIRSTYDYAEPGVIFIDRVNSKNPLGFSETICASNPCGEQMLPPYGACVLGSVNLARLISQPFTATAHIDFARLGKVVTTAVRFLDNVISVSNYPLKQQAVEAESKRRIGLGITGLADALIMLGIRYGTGAAQEKLSAIMRFIRDEAMEASRDLAGEKGAYPLWTAEHGPKRRNSHLLSIAPTGTISLFAGNVSSGIEPVWDVSYQRNVLQPDGSHHTVECHDYAARMLMLLSGTNNNSIIVTANQLTPAEHIAMVAAAQPFVDSAISKTINCPREITFDEFSSVYTQAFDLGLKGCTTYRPNDVRGEVLVSKGTKPEEAEVTIKRTVPIREAGNVVQLGEPLKRPRTLPGTTYKIKPAGAEHAMYVTITDYVEADGRRRPFELFINSKQVDGQAWTLALSKMISAVFRRGGDIAFVGEELKAVFDPRGGFFEHGSYVPSLAAAIGGVIEEHIREQSGEDEQAPYEPPVASSRLHCPKCQVGALVSREGCWSCNSCTYTKC